MKLANQISDLLFDYDCVIVPGFGGFIGNVSPARVDELRSRFHPPRKEISFNRQLINNDGLLINAVSRTHSVSYDEAAGQVKAQVEDWLIKLEAKSSVQLPEIGTVHVDHNDKWRFEPDLSVNFSRASFGLPVMTVAPVKKLVGQEPIAQPTPIKQLPIDQDTTAPATEQTAKVVGIGQVGEETSQPSDRKVRRILAYAAVILPFLLYVGIVGPRINTNNFQASDLNPFREKPCASYQPRVTQGISAEMLDFDGGDVLLAYDEEFINVDLTETGKSKIVVRLKEHIPAVAVSTAVATTHNGEHLRFHVIGGCFSDKANANKLVNELNKQGFQAHLLDQRKGLWRVAYNSYKTRNEALQGLDRVRSNHEKNAWLLIK